jgi:hypothetical protein
MAWRQSQDSGSLIGTTGGTSQTGAKKTGTAGSADEPETPRRPGKADESDDETARRQMGLWLEDDSIAPDEAARRLWAMASDVHHSEDVRMDALANCLNLVEDPQFQKEFLPSLTTKGVWTGDIGEALLDDLYNRSDQVKLGAAASLLANAEGDFKDHLRDILRFQLDAEDADDDTLIRLAAKKAAEPEESTGGE